MELVRQASAYMAHQTLWFEDALRADNGQDMEIQDAYVHLDEDLRMREELRTLLVSYGLSDILTVAD